MTRSELIAIMASRSEALRLSDMDLIVDTIISSMTDAMIEGRRIELRGFGSFSIKTRDARQARNPRTGESVMVPARRSLHFKAGKKLRDTLNNS